MRGGGREDEQELWFAEDFIGGACVTAGQVVKSGAHTHTQLLVRVFNKGRGVRVERKRARQLWILIAFSRYV